MIKISKWHFLATITLAMLISSSVYATLMPNANAKDANTLTAKGLAIINQVAGIDLTNCTATPTLDVAGSYLGVLPSESIQYTFTGSGRTIEIQDTFTNGSLQIMDVLENNGSPQTPTFLVSVSHMAEGFLLEYQIYSGNAFYGQLASMLNNADPAKNSTTTVGNVKFEITTTTGNSANGNCTTFTWSYVFNGVDADCKCVSLSYENGFLNGFVDTWNLYPIGSTKVNLSEQQADAIAMKTAKACSWSIGTGDNACVINNFNVTKPMVEQLLFSNAGNLSNVRSSDPLTLYPMWQIGVGLDKFYPGNVYGIYVDVWADTGQIRDTHEAISPLPPPEGMETATIAESSIRMVNNQTATAASGFNVFPVLWTALAAFAVFTMMAAPVWLNRKKPLSRSLHSLKLRKISGVMLCFMIGSVALVALVSVVPAVNAANPSCANIWGDSSTGNEIGTENGNAVCTLYHNSTELTDQAAISQLVTTWFQDCGYTSNNYQQNSQTTESTVLDDTQSADINSPAVATVYFDHGIGKNGNGGYGNPPGIPAQYPNEWHYMLCSDEANNGSNYQGDVFDYMIYQETTDSNYQYTNNYFSYISTCESANLSASQLPNYTGSYGSNPTSNGGSGNPIGMPYAWTHEYTTSSPTTSPPQGYMSKDGYDYPDSGTFCYIGFPYGSPSLSQSIDPYNSATYYNFVYYFFEAALLMHYSVNRALDYASQNVYSGYFTFNGTPLFDGFKAYWAGYQPSPSADCTMTVYGDGNIYLYPGCPDYISLPSISDTVPSVGIAGTQYQFSASSADPYPNHSLTYTFNWGDGSTPTQTSSPINVPHTYTSDGVYTVTVTATSSTGLAVQSSTAVTIGNMLTLVARDLYFGEPLSAYVYVDNVEYETPITIPVTQGTHTVLWSPYAWDPYWNHIASLYNIYDVTTGQYYSNDASVPVNSPTELEATYAYLP